MVRQLAALGISLSPSFPRSLIPVRSVEVLQEGVAADVRRIHPARPGQQNSGHERHYRQGIGQRQRWGPRRTEKIGTPAHHVIHRLAGMWNEPMSSGWGRQRGRKRVTRTGATAQTQCITVRLEARPKGMGEDRKRRMTIVHVMHHRRLRRGRE